MATLTLRSLNQQFLNIAGNPGSLASRITRGASIEEISDGSEQPVDNFSKHGKRKAGSVNVEVALTLLPCVGILA